MDSNDGFVTVMKNSRSTRAVGDAPRHVGFGTQSASMRPFADDMPPRADWQWDGNGTLRLRCHEKGQFKLAKNSASTYQITAQSLYSLLGRRLSGRYPITRIDGNDIYIDISEIAAEVK